ncbi:hypothetical protein BH09PSE4_BH09PSE4_10890 [soil metagenome]
MTPKTVVRRWIAAFNAADSEALAALYREDATSYGSNNEAVIGREAIRAEFESEFARGAIEYVPENLVEDGEWAVLEWTDPKGDRGCGLFHVIDGKIALQRGYRAG